MSRNTFARTVFVGADPVAAEALLLRLEGVSGEDVVLARTAIEACRAVEAVRPRLVIVDTALPGCGSAFVRWLRARCPDVTIVARASCAAPRCCVSLLEAGVDALVVRQAPDVRVAYAVERALGGCLYVDDTLPPATLALVSEGPRVRSLRGCSETRETVRSFGYDSATRKR